MSRRPQPTWLRAGDAANALGINRSTLYRWHLAGLIPARAILHTGRRYRYSREWATGQVAK